MDERHSTGLHKVLTTPYLLNPPHDRSASYDAHPPGSPATTVATSSSSSSPHYHDGALSAAQQEEFPDSPIAQRTGMPDRVFQVLRNDESREVLCSYPHSGYDPADFGRLAVGVSMSSHGQQHYSEEHAAKTSCTRRLECNRNVVDRTSGGAKPVGSLYIPHGCIIFACHNVKQGETTPQEANYPPEETSRNTFQYHQGGQPSMSSHEHFQQTAQGHSAYQHPVSSNSREYEGAYREYLPTHSPQYGVPQAPQPFYSSSESSLSNFASNSTQRPPLSHSHSHSRRNQGAYGPVSTAYPSQRTQPSPPSGAFSPLTAQSLARANSTPGAVPHLDQNPDAGRMGWPSSSGTWGHQFGPLTTEPTGDINGEPLLPPVDMVTPSSTSSQSLDDYSSGNSSGGPSSAPPTGNSYFPAGPHLKTTRSHSNNMVQSPVLLKRSSEDRMYGGSAVGSGEEGSASPPGGYGPQSQIVKQHAQYPTSYQATPGPYDAHAAPVGSSVKEEQPASMLPHPLIPTHREPAGSRSNGNPPPGVTQCVSCGIINSPEWRKGENGVKNLCNACGLRYARSKQKREGILPQRRKKKDKNNVSPKSKKLNKNRRPGDDQPMVEERYYQSSMQDGRHAYSSSGGEGPHQEEAYYADPAQQYYGGVAGTRHFDGFQSSDDFDGR